MAESWSDYRKDKQRQRQRDENARRISPREQRMRRKRTIQLLLIAIGTVLLASGIYYWIFLRAYHGTRVIQTSSQEDTVSSRYLEMNGRILRYTQDEVSLENRSLEPLWSYSYRMTNPTAYVKGTHAVIADLDGTSMVILNKDGVTGTVSTPYTIVKACVSRKGLVAAILDGGVDTWINFYSTDGSLIAENQTTMEDPGYPLDLALSDNGVIMMVAYQYVKGSETTSYVAFYNFGDVGQNEDDHIVSGYTYEGTVMPQIETLDSGHSVAFRDDGFTVYTGSQVPKESKTVNIDREIVSTFCDESHIGLVFKNNSTENLYRMQVYSANGDLRYTKEFNIAYTTIKMSQGNILMYNNTQLCVMTDTGRQRFFGTIDGTINSCTKIGMNRYLLVLDNGVNIVRLT